MRAFIILLWAISGFGCTGVAPYVDRVGSFDTGSGLLIIYRPRAPNPGSQPLRNQYPEIQLDEQSIGLLRFNEMLRLEVPPGDHDLRVTGLTTAARWKQRDITRHVKITPGEKKFFRLNVLYNVDEIRLLKRGTKYNVSLVSVKENDAIYELREIDASR